MPVKPWSVGPKKSLGIFSGLGDVQDERAQRQKAAVEESQRLEDRLAAKEMRDLQKRSLEQALAEAGKPKAPTVVGETIDPTTGEVWNRYSDGTRRRAGIADDEPRSTPAVGSSHENDDAEHMGGPSVPQQAPSTAPTARKTLTLGVKKPEPKAKRTTAVKDKRGIMVVMDLDTGLGLDGKPIEAWHEPERPVRDPAEGKPTEAQAKAVAFNHRVVPAGQRLNTFDDRNVLDQISAKAGMFGNWTKTDRGRQLEQAGRTWVTSVLRPESGATITPEEMESYQVTYLPVPGDDELTLAQKRQARREAEEGVSLMAGKFLPKGTPRSAMEADSTANPAAFMRKYHPGAKPDPTTFKLGRR